MNIQKFLGSDRGIFPFPSWYPEFALDALHAWRHRARADFYQKMASINALSVNEIRGSRTCRPSRAATR